MTLFYPFVCVQEVCESDAAKDVFEGRLTADMVAEKLGHTNYRELPELNLQSNSIRYISYFHCDTAVKMTLPELKLLLFFLLISLCLLGWWIWLLLICLVICAVLI